MTEDLQRRIMKAAESDPDILCRRSEIESTLGSDAHYLANELGITKRDLIRLEREGLALKARYVTKEGPHRVRWLIFFEVLDGRV